jgi:hypothetical protein
MSKENIKLDRLRQEKSKALYSTYKIVENIKTKSFSLLLISLSSQQDLFVQVSGHPFPLEFPRLHQVTMNEHYQKA